MKNKEIILPVSALIFSAVFYGQLAGLNFMLFSLLIISLISYFHPQKIKEPRWWFYCGCVVLTAFAIIFVNSDLSIFAWIISLLVFSNKSIYSKHSTLLNGGFAGYSLLTSPIGIGMDLHRYFNEKNKPDPNHNKKIVFGIIAAVIISLAFLFLYMGANPLFNKFMRTLNLNWFDTGWVFVTFAGVLTSYGLLYSKDIKFLSDFDLPALRDISNNGDNKSTGMPGTAIIAVALFSFLNIMLLIINSLDFFNLYVTQQLPEGITLSDFVHDAVSALIASIVIGVCLIAWIFNGELNFNRFGKIVKLLTQAWIAQNALVIISAVTRNYWYVQQYHLTHLRIGVYVFLALAFCGLFLTNRKVTGKKSYWWLVTRNVQIWFVIIIVSSVINWDKLVTNYNINSSGPGKKLDKEYILSLSDANIPQLIKLNNQGAFNRKEKLRFYKKVIHAYEKNHLGSWQSFNWRSIDNNKAMLEIKVN